MSLTMPQVSPLSANGAVAHAESAQLRGEQSRLGPKLTRTSGILLHPTSLPGPFGIGDLGPAAFRWVETLAAMKQSWWQILPLGPTGAGDSPYQSYSAFAGNINLLSPEFLERDGLVHNSFWAGQSFSAHAVDYPRVKVFKQALLEEAWRQFRSGRGPASLREDFERYRQEERAWLMDYSLFIAIHEELKGMSLVDWPVELRRRDPRALSAARRELGEAVTCQEFGQFLFDRQWQNLKAFAAERGVRIIGDVPIFVALDSADVWTHAEQFLLDDAGRPTVVSGVPPDYFSADGQYWGNPLYDWNRMAQSGYAWWIARLKRILRQVDLVRLDHFRGFRQSWHIPAAEKTARNGRWVDGPGEPFFQAVHDQLGGLPLIAEDLGHITPDVDQLRLRFGLPGMKVLMFALDKPTNPYWPHNYEPHSVCYTGTHDNDTVNGWYATLNQRDRDYLRDYIGQVPDNPAWYMIRLAWASVSVLAMTPLQDLLGLGSEARMNRPGVPEGNWRWRFRSEQFHPNLIGSLAHLTTLFNRDPSIRENEGK